MKPKRPRPIHADPLTARVARGPRADARWYWRADRADGSGGRETVWCAWGTVAEIQRRLGASVAAGETHRPDPAPRAHGAPPTVRDLLEVWCGGQQQRADLSPASVDCYLVAARRLVADELGDVALLDVRRATVEGYRDRQLRARRASATVRLDMTILGTAWRWAMEEGWVARALPRVRVVSRGGRLRYTPSRAEIGALAAQSDGWQRVALLLLGATGCRIGEIADLCWAQVDLSGARVTVSGKTGERVVPLGAGIVATLREWRLQQPGERVWPAVSAGQGLRLALRQGCRDLGIAHVTPHGLRRAAVDALYQSGADVGAAAQILGHSAATALRHYRRASAADLVRAVERAGLGGENGSLSQHPVTTRTYRRLSEGSQGMTETEIDVNVKGERR